MLYLDLAMYLHSLSAETKIIIFQLSFLTFEILYFFWLRKYFNEQEKRIREYYRQSRQKEMITIPECIVINPRPKRNDPIYRIQKKNFLCIVFFIFSASFCETISIYSNIVLSFCYFFDTIQNFPYTYTYTFTFTKTHYTYYLLLFITSLEQLTPSSFVISPSRLTVSSPRRSLVSSCHKNKSFSKSSIL